MCFGLTSESNDVLCPAIITQTELLNTKKNINTLNICLYLFDLNSLCSRPSLPPVFCALTSASTPESGPSSASTAGRPSPRTPPTTATSGGPTPGTSRSPATCAGPRSRRTRSSKTTSRLTRVSHYYYYYKLIYHKCAFIHFYLTLSVFFILFIEIEIIYLKDVVKIKLFFTIP